MPALDVGMWVYVCDLLDQKIRLVECVRELACTVVFLHE